MLRTLVYLSLLVDELHKLFLRRVDDIVDAPQLFPCAIAEPLHLLQLELPGA
jgi:hypothetical protein